jgi:hypothetical protein
MLRVLIITLLVVAQSFTGIAQSLPPETSGFLPKIFTSRSGEQMPVCGGGNVQLAPNLIMFPFGLSIVKRTRRSVSSDLEE